MPRRKRRRAWGSIDPVKPNAKYILRWYENTPHGRVRRCETFYGTYKQADLRLSQIRLEHAEDAPCATVGQAYTLWYLPSITRRMESSDLSEGSFKQYTRIWDSVVSPRWRGVPLDSVRPLDVQEWLSAQKRGNAQAALSVLRSIGALAERYEVAPNRFAIKYELPPSENARRKGVLTLDQADAMFHRLHGARCEPAFILACFGSCRSGESLGARVDEVSSFEVDGLVFATVPITRRMEHSGCLPVESLKTPESRRTVCVPPPYPERLLDIAHSLARDRIEWLAHRGDGLPMNRGQLAHAWAAESGNPVPFQNLRNSWRTFAQLEWGVGSDTLELLMGHKLPGTTGAHYMRPKGDTLAHRFAEDFATRFSKLGKVRQN